MTAAGDGRGKLVRGYSIISEHTALLRRPPTHLQSVLHAHFTLSFILIGCLHDPANFQQSSSKRPANI